MSYTLPALPFAFDALEPYMDAETLKIHHGKHHQNYVNKLNEALEKAPELKDQPLETLLANPEQLPSAVRTAVVNNGGGHWNHSFFWTVLGPKSSKEPTGEIAKAITESFGDFKTFQEKFNTITTTHFGSGWGWLCVDAQGKLALTSTHDQEVPMRLKLKPVLTMDVWEHAYYLKYRNERAKFVEAVWNVVNWTEVNSKYLAALK
jgi:Fe-Mn family superoxide dismutase